MRRCGPSALLDLLLPLRRPAEHADQEERQTGTKDGSAEMLQDALSVRVVHVPCEDDLALTGDRQDDKGSDRAVQPARRIGGCRRWLLPLGPPEHLDQEEGQRSAKDRAAVLDQHLFYERTGHELGAD